MQSTTLRSVRKTARQANEAAQLRRSASHRGRGINPALFRARRGVSAGQSTISFYQRHRWRSEGLV